MWFGWPEGPLVVLALLLNLAFWGGLVLLVVWAVKQFRPGPPPSPGPPYRGDEARDPAMRILEERFARGEIDADEFQRRRDVLRGQR